MDLKKLKKVVRMSVFLPEYCGISYTVSIKHKMRGVDGNKKPVQFNAEEMDQIRKGFELFNTTINENMERL